MLWTVARAEAAFLKRSRLALISAAIFAICLVFACLSSALFLAEETHHRAEHQAEANEIFETQPDRHPHRMVHYGQYAFRTPPPLAAIDPGLDPYGGTAIFLEGHRQNAAMFAQAAEGATLTRFGSLTPAFVLQVLAPLLLILLGYSSITRERETGTLRALLAQGSSMRTLAGGKAIILLAAAGLCLVPLALIGFGMAVFGGAGFLSATSLVVTYALYLSLWAFAVVGVSLLSRRGSSALLVLASLWLGTVVILPKLAADVATQIAPLKSAFERDMEVKNALRALGDAHNLNDPAYVSFQQNVLAQYGADSVDTLPVNIKGLLAVEGERQGAAVLAGFNAKDMAARKAQRNWIGAASLLSPMIAAHSASQSLAGTDLDAYHRFLTEAEAHRLVFVQALNMLQATEVDIKLDKIKSIDVQAEKATRVSAEAWSTLPRFDFRPAPLRERISLAAPYLAILSLWFGALLFGFLSLTRRTRL